MGHAEDFRHGSTVMTSFHAEQDTVQLHWEMEQLPGSPDSLAGSDIEDAEDLKRLLLHMSHDGDDARAAARS